MAILYSNIAKNYEYFHLDFIHYLIFYQQKILWMIMDLLDLSF